MRIFSVAIASSIVGLGLLVSSGNAQAANLVTNGSFETSGGAGQLGDNGTGNTSVTGWSIPTVPNSYSFVFTPGSADTTGVNGSQYGNLKLWGPGDGSANGLPATSPDGGNYLAIDSAFQNNGVSSISQTLNGLTAGQTYIVSFYDAAAQQQSFNGSTFDQWKVSLGSQTQSATAFSIPNHGFSGWKAESLPFTATASSEVLNFLATGGPNGLPPFALLDGVSVTAVPEPSFVWGLSAMMAVGLGAVLKGKLATKK